MREEFIETIYGFITLQEMDLVLLWQVTNFSRVWRQEARGTDDYV